jgi:hypothetical protein
MKGRGRKKIREKKANRCEFQVSGDSSCIQLRVIQNSRRQNQIEEEGSCIT